MQNSKNNFINILNNNNHHLNIHIHNSNNNYSSLTAQPPQSPSLAILSPLSLYPQPPVPQPSLASSLSPFYSNSALPPSLDLGFSVLNFWPPPPPFIFVPLATPLSAALGPKPSLAAALGPLAYSSRSALPPSL